MKNRWVTTILGLVIALSLTAAYTAFAATGPAFTPEPTGPGVYALRLTPEQRVQREALCDKMLENLTAEQRRQMEKLRSEMRGNQGATTAPSAAAALGTSSDI